MSKGYTIYARAWRADEWPEQGLKRGYVAEARIKADSGAFDLALGSKVYVDAHSHTEAAITAAEILFKRLEERGVTE